MSQKDAPLVGQESRPQREAAQMTSQRDFRLQWVLIIVTVVGLAIDAFVHLHLAHDFAQVKTSTMSQADLFRVEAVLAIIAAVALLARPRRWSAALAFVVAGGGLVAVVLYRYVNVGKIGPIPNMYDPYWAPAEKTLSVIAELVATLSALALFMMFSGRLRRGGPDGDGR